MKKRAQILIATATLAAAAVLSYGVTHLAGTGLVRFAVLLVVTILASRLRLSLPGLQGSIAFNLPFLLLAATELSFGEAVVIATVATAVQCLPFRPGMRPMQALFNVATLVNATALTALAFSACARSAFPNLALPAAAAVFFLANTVPVAMVIAFTEDKRLGGTWSAIFNCSFPYFVLSTGVTSLIVTADQLLGWQVSLVALAAMFGVWHCYRNYFAGTTASAERAALLAREMAAD